MILPKKHYWKCDLSGSILQLKGHFCPLAPPSKRQEGQLPLLPPPQFRRPWLYLKIQFHANNSFIIKLTIMNTRYGINCMHCLFVYYSKYMTLTCIFNQIINTIHNMCYRHLSISLSLYTQFSQYTV